MNNTDLCYVSEMNSTIIKYIENCNYTSSDFLIYYHIILSAIFKYIEVTTNQFYRNKVDRGVAYYIVLI